MRTVVAAVFLLGIASSAQAQTHPCDQTAPTTVTVQSSGTYKAQFCAKPADGLEAMVVYVNGTASDLRPLVMTVAANAAGFALYEGPQELRFPRGSYQVQVSVYNRAYPDGPTQESGRSNPLALTGVDDNPPPSTPKLMGIIR